MKKRRIARNENTKMTMEDLEYVIECLTEILKGE